MMFAGIKDNRIGIIVWLVVLGLIVAGVVWLFRAMTSRSADLRRRSSALDMLEERYARGEIKRDEYLEKRRDLAA